MGFAPGFALDNVQDFKVAANAFLRDAARAAEPAPAPEVLLRPPPSGRVAARVALLPLSCHFLPRSSPLSLDLLAPDRGRHIAQTIGSMCQWSALDAIPREAAWCTHWVGPWRISNHPQSPEGDLRVIGGDCGSPAITRRLYAGITGDYGPPAIIRG